jgi:hypothetical protein
MAPALVNWTNPGGGTWETPANWSTGSLPGPDDDVVISTLNPGATITHASDNSSIHSLTSNLAAADAFAMTGGTLSIATASTLGNNLTFNFSGGIVTGDGNVTFNGLLNWTGGTMQGVASTTVNGGMNISGPNGKTLDQRTLTIPGDATVTWAGTGNIGLSNGAVINNQAGATFLVQTDGDQRIVANGFANTSAFNNAGTFRKFLSTGTVTVEIPFSNSGTIDLQTGTLVLADGGMSSGSFTVAQGSTLNFGGGTHRLDANSSVSGAGNVVFSDGFTGIHGTFNITGSTTISGNAGVDLVGPVGSVGATLTISGSTTTNFYRNNISTSTATMSGGVLLGVGGLMVTGLMTWTGGTMSGTGSTTIGPGATLVINGPGTKVLDGRTLNLQSGASATWTGTGNIDLNNGAVINNQQGATFNVQIDQNVRTNGALAAFNNNGTFLESTSTGTSTISAQFNNTGSVEVQTGTLVLAGGGTSTGTFAVTAIGDPNATLNFGGGTHRLVGANSSVSGPGKVVFSGGTIEVAGNYNITGSTTVAAPQFGPPSVSVRFPGTVVSLGASLMLGSQNGNTTSVDFVNNDINVASATITTGSLLGVGNATFGQLTWTGGTMGDTGTTTISPNGTLTIMGANVKTLDTRILNISTGATANWTGTGDISLLNGAVINNQTGATFNVQIGDRFSTNGTLAAFNNAGLFHQFNSTGTAVIATQFNNSGSVQVDTGTVVFSVGGTSDGTFTVAQSANLEFGGGTHRLNTSVSGAGNVTFSSGAVDVVGTYNVAGTTTITETPFVGAATVRFTGPIANIGSNLVISGNATVDFADNNVSVASATMSGGRLLSSGDFGIAGVMTWSGGTMGDFGSTTVASGARLTISGSADKILDGRTLNVNDSAAVTWTGTGNLGISNGAIINNLANGTFTVNNNQSFTSSGAIGTFNNAGTFRKTISSGPTTVNMIFNNSATGTVFVDNNGTLVLAGGGISTGSFVVTSAAGTLDFGGGNFFRDYLLLTGSSVSGPGAVAFSGDSTTAIAGTYAITGTTTVMSNVFVVFLNDASSGAFSNTGATVVVETGTTLTVNGNYSQTSGTTNVDGATLTATNVSIGRNSILFASGTINVNNGSGTLTNDGELDLGGPATPGLLTINGNYMQTFNGSLIIKIGGTAAGTQFDQLNISGTASLNGSLTARLIDNYSPPSGTTFQFLICGGTRSGQFATTNLGGHFVPPIYDPNDVTLQAS